MAFHSAGKRVAPALLALGAIAAAALLTGAVANPLGGAQLRVPLTHFTRFPLAPSTSFAPPIKVGGLAADDGDDGTAIEITRPLRLGNRTLARLPIAIDADSRVMLPVGPLAAALQSGGVDTGALAGRDAGSTIALDELAAAGLAIRYDPDSDALMLPAN